MLLWYCKIPYEDVYMPLPMKEPEKWAAMKPEFEFGQVPVVEIDGKRLAQSAAIMNYIARKRDDIIPKDPYQQYLAESMQENLVDIYIGQFPVFRASKEEKPEANKKFVKDMLDPRLTCIENRLKANETQDFLVGKSLTIPDILYMCVYYSNWQDPVQSEERNAIYKEVLDKHPLFVSYVENIRKIFAEYFEKVRLEPEIII